MYVSTTLCILFLVAPVPSASASDAFPRQSRLDAPAFQRILSADSVCAIPGTSEVAILDRESKKIWAVDPEAGSVQVAHELVAPDIPSGVRANRLWSGHGRLFLDLTGEPYFVSIDLESGTFLDIPGLTHVLSMAPSAHGFVVVADLEQSRFALTDRDLVVREVFGSRCPVRPDEDVLALACFSSVASAGQGNVLVCDDLTGACFEFDVVTHEKATFRGAEVDWSMPERRGSNQILVERRVMAVAETPNGRRLVLCTAAGLYGEPTLEVYGSDGLTLSIPLGRDYQQISVVGEDLVVALEPGPGFRAALVHIGAEVQVLAEEVE